MAKSKDEKFWDTEEEVGIQKKNDKGDFIIVKNVTKNGKKYVDVRNYYTGEDAQLHPGKGIAIPDDLADEIANMILESGVNKHD